MPASFDLLLLFGVVALLGYRLYSLLGTQPSTQVPPEVQKAAENAYQTFLKNEKLTFAQTSEEGLKEIILKHPFLFPDFVLGAKKAFEMVLLAFAKGELSTVKPLVSDRLYKAFLSQIKKRAEKKQTAEFELTRFKSIEVTAASLTKTVASISLCFDTEQVNVLKDSKGKVIDGSQEMLQDATDTWTFTRDMAGSSSVWTVVDVQ